MKKKALKYARAITLTLAFAAAAVEWTGYAPFDRPDGSNALCDKDPTCRPLTAGEVKLAQSVFGDAIDYRRVKIFNRHNFGIPVDQGAMLMAPNGNIYVTDSFAYKRDFSKERGFQQQSFIHEMTHVWQHQKGMNVRLAAIAAYVGHDFNYSSAYKIDDEDERDIGQLNLEQQAEAVEKYFIARETLEKNNCTEAAIVFSSSLPRCADIREEKRELEKKLAPRLPLGPAGPGP